MLLMEIKEGLAERRDSLVIHQRLDTIRNFLNNQQGFAETDRMILKFI